MYRSTTRWTTTVAAAALIALPLAASAQQTPPPSQPPQQQSQPPAQPTTQPPAQPTTQPPAQPSAEPATGSGQLDAAAAKTHLSAARDTLSQITALPEAAKLQGEARTQVSQVISNFNELITTQNDWRSVYSRVDANLTALLGAETGDAATGTGAAGVAGAVGTAGTTGTPPAAATGPTGTQLDPAVRTKLMEFRKHLKEFEKAAGGPAPAAAPSSSAAHADHQPSAMAPTGATGTSPAGATGTSGMTPAPTATPDQSPASRTQAEQAGHSEADKHLDAISAILAKSKSGALTSAQTAQLKKHVAELRTVLKQGR